MLSSVSADEWNIPSKKKVETMLASYHILRNHLSIVLALRVRNDLYNFHVLQQKNNNLSWSIFIQLTSAMRLVWSKAGRKKKSSSAWSWERVLVGTDELHWVSHGEYYSIPCLLLIYPRNKCNIENVGFPAPISVHCWYIKIPHTHAEPTLS